MNAGFTAHTKQSDEWETPTWLFDALDHEFGFNLDGAARKENAKCKEFSTVETPVLWNGRRVFCNPPYSNIGPFVKLAKTAELAVLVLPNRANSDWFRWLDEWRVERRFFRSRVCFLREGVEMRNPRIENLIAVVRP